ncbi:adenine phosphoribosyltransferase [Patescibacteria group bacterium]|nr:adenine phosphoribosyltransferase [Patescibacteria group bacterium]
MNLKSKIREIPDWPIKGVNFKDISTIIEDKEAFRYVIDKLLEPYQGQKIDKVVGIDARGFLFCSAMAYRLGAGCVMIRKKGKLPWKTIGQDYALEYGANTIEMHQDSIKPGERVIIVDDLLATGGTMAATVDLVKQLGGEIAGISFIIDLVFLKGKEKIKDYPVHTLVEYESE